MRITRAFRPEFGAICTFRAESIFALDVRRASYIAFGEKRRMVRWTVEGGVEVLRHPDDKDQAG